MVKGCCFLPLKTKEPPEIKDFNVTLYIITPIGVDEIRSLSAVWNPQLVCGTESAACLRYGIRSLSAAWNPQLVCGMESTQSVVCNQSEGEIHADA